MSTNQLRTRDISAVLSRTSYWRHGSNYFNILVNRASTRHEYLNSIVDMGQT